MATPPPERPDIQAARPERKPSVWRPQPVPTPGPGRSTEDPRTPTLRELARRGAEPAVWVVLEYLHADDDTPMAGAPYRARFADGSVRTGTLDARGTARIDGLPSSLASTPVAVTFGEVPDAYRALRPEDAGAPNPRYRGELASAQLFGRGPLLASAGAVTADALPRPYADAPDDEGGVLDFLWGVLLGDWAEDPSTGQIVAGALVTMIPVVDQIADVRDVAAQLYLLSDEEKRRDPWAWVALVVVAVGLVPVAGSAMKGVLRLVMRSLQHGAEGTTRRAVFEVLRRLGRGDPARFIDQYLTAGGIAAAATRHLRPVLAKLESFFQIVAGSWLVPARVQAGARRALASLAAITAAAPRAIHEAARRLEEGLRTILRRGSSDGVVEGATNSVVEARAATRAAPDGDAARASSRDLFAAKRPTSELEHGARRGSAPDLLHEPPRRPADWPAEYDLTDPRRTWVNNTFARAPEPDTLPEGTRIYRIVDADSNPGGGFWTLEPPPATEAQWRSGWAVKNEWNGDGAYVEHTVGRDGLRVWRGPAAAQDAAVPSHVLAGGGEQLYIPPELKAVTPSPPRRTPWNR